MERIDEPSSAQLNINDLPQELLENIFSFLNIRERIKIERVCKNWRYIGTTFHWKIKELKFNYCSDRDLTDYMLEEILKRCRKCVLFLDLGGCSRLTAKALSIIGNHCPNLRSVKFRDLMDLTDCDLEYFSNKCIKLKEVVLISWRYGEDGLISFLKSCQELKVLHIYHNNISGQCFEFISPKVKELKLTDCQRLTSEGILKLGKCKCIEHLELWDCPGFDTASLEEILKQNCNSLKHFGLNGKVSPLINLQALPYNLLTKLESISFRHNCHITDDTLLHIAHICKNLRTLDVSCSYFIIDGLQHLTRCPLLTTLDVSYIHRITDESIIPLAMVGKLESLAIRGNRNITDNACKMLAVHCTKLKYLDLRGCRGITDATAHSFINAMELRNNGHRELKIFAEETRITVFIEEEEFIIANKYFPEKVKNRW